MSGMLLRLRADIKGSDVPSLKSLLKKAWGPVDVFW